MYRILHLSDLHAREKSQWSTTPILKEAKKAILAEASRVNIDLVVFSGDIAFSGKKAEYDIAQAWLDDLCLGTSGLNIDKGQILTIPGNHDVDRALITSGVNSIERTLSEAKSQANVAQIYQEADSRELLLKRHKAYFEFCTSFLGTTSNHCWSKTFKAGSGRLRIDGINTSWLSRGDDDRGRLLVGQPQLSEVIESHNDADLRITMMHHPLSALMEFDESNTADYLKQNSDIVLRGHLHKAETTFRITNMGSYLELAAGALHENFEAQNRFSILDFEDDLSVLRVTTLVWLGGKWKVDKNLYDTPDGVGVFDLKKK